MARSLTPWLRIFALASVASLGACDKSQETGPQPVRIEGVHQRTGDGGVIDEGHLVTRLGGSLGERANLRIAGSTDRGSSLGAELWYQEKVTEDGEREVYLQAQIEVPADLRSSIGGLIHATVILEREVGGQASLDDDVVAAAGRAFAVLDTRLALARGDQGVVRELLGDDDPELVLLALEWIREHTPAAFAGDLVASLEHQDDRVSALAVECLGYTGDRSLVGPILRNARPMSRLQIREVYRALARLRGADALGYLRFAAANEDDSLLQEEAERSLRLALTGIPAGSSITTSDPAGRLARGHRQ